MDPMAGRDLEAPPGRTRLVGRFRLCETQEVTGRLLRRTWTRSPHALDLFDDPDYLERPRQPGKGQLS